MPKKDGEYSVRLGYHIARLVQKEMLDYEECSESNTNIPIWSRLWKVRIPNKVKFFGWRAGHEILPTGENLAKRQILKEDTCQLCKLGSKSVLHVLWDCVVASDVWAGSLTWLQKSGSG